MSRFSRFGPDPAQFVTPEEQAATLRAANERKRKPRPGQLLPVIKSTGRKRSSSPDDSQQSGDHQSTGQQQPCSQHWKQRKERSQQEWAQRRDDNRSLAVQHQAFLSEGLQLQQLANAVSAAATAVAKAAHLHACCYAAADNAAAEEAQLQQKLMSLQQQQPVPVSTHQQQQVPVQPDLAQQAQQHQGDDQQRGPASDNVGQQHGQQALLSVVGTRPVAVHTLVASFWFPVPTIECRCCAEKWEVQPAAAGFFGSTPKVPYTWFSQQVLNLYTPLSTSGASATSMATALDMNNVRQMDAGLKIKPWQLSGAWTEWRRVAQALGAAGIAGSLAGSSLGPAVYCPACAVVADDSGTAATSGAGSSAIGNHTASSCAEGDLDLEELAKRYGLLPGAVSMAQVGPTGKPIVPVACFDANAKANRYQSAGKASSTSFEQLPPGRFFAQAHADVWGQQAAGGGLPLSSTGSSGLGSNSASGADAADLELETVMQDDCHPNLSCARDTSQCSSISDVCGVAAGVCAHGQPLAGCALAMPAPERLLYYDLLMSHILKDADVQVMYLDTGCRYAAHWRLHMPSDPAPAVIKVPWWHARGHGASCFLKNSGFYLPGSGRRVGENCEQLWAQVRPLLKLTRYMGKGNYLFVLDDALLLVAEEKMGSFVAFMCDQARAIKKKLGLTSAKIREAITTAADLGFSKQQLLQAAVKTMQAATQPNLPDNESAEERRMRLLAEYVRCSEEQSVLHTLQGRRSAVAVALPGTERRLQSQAEHAKRVARLLKRMAQLTVDLQLQEPLSEGSPEYQQGMAVLRDQQLCHLQQQVEREAAALGEITQVRRGMGESCQQTRNQEKKAQRRRANIRQLVETMCAWQQKDLPDSAVSQQLPAQWTEQAIKQLFSGQFPWQHSLGGAGQLPSLLVERFRDACAEEARTLEEQVMLRVERQRTVKYFQHLGSLATAAAANMQVQHCELTDNLPEVPPDADVTVVAASWKEHLQQITQLSAQQLLHEEWGKRFCSWAQQAHAAFERIQ